MPPLLWYCDGIRGKQTTLCTDDASYMVRQMFEILQTYECEQSRSHKNIRILHTYDDAICKTYIYIYIIKTKPDADLQPYTYNGGLAFRVVLFILRHTILLYTCIVHGIPSCALAKRYQQKRCVPDDVESEKRCFVPVKNIYYTLKCIR